LKNKNILRIFEIKIKISANFEFFGKLQVLGNWDFKKKLFLMESKNC
jgi:hypothetical protein